ncbi:RNA polymerase sigma-70 factor [Candidatus Entotheonella palauensis]|uniref:RNA polymerase sigma-70 factor n=1 Tax=Candidatus Entotheonella palauensis TaxID=93172 RepID=UPI000B7D7A48|nr:RNA polymerase sigma-70 factor [Candidatus Entotheonella palauensis]
MDYLDIYETHRQHLFGVAYRMLGTVADAEDVLQDAFLRWQHADHEAVTAPRAYLTATVTRLAIDRLRQLKSRREDYIGPWLPEPLVQPPGSHPVELANAISMAILSVLEQLGPVERAVFLLREVFDYDYPDIAPVVERSAANCRKIFQRARDHVHTAQVRYTPTPEQHQNVTQQFMTSIRSGDLDGLIAVLKDDITLTPDGGGKVPSARVPLIGSQRVARFLIGIARKAPPSLRLHPCGVNGQPGVWIEVNGAVDGVMTWDIDADQITAIRIIRNPDKLRHITTHARVRPTSKNARDGQA